MINIEKKYIIKGMSHDILPNIPSPKNKIIAYVRNTNILFLGLILILIMTMAAIMALDITNRASKRLADLYAIETVGRFNLQVKQDNLMEFADILPSIQLHYDEMLDSLFAHYDLKNVKGYIIDNHGIIQISSTRQERHEDKIHINALNSDAQFCAEIETHLQNINGYFDSKTEAKAIKLARGPYGYASIAPIIDTDWSVVTFFDHNSLYSVWNLLPLLITLLSAFLIYTLINGIVMRRVVLLPLDRLTKSLTAQKLNASEIFGRDRKDEIGELARTMQKMWDHLGIDNANLLHAARERERLIRIDQLTNIPNRRNFDERLPLEWGRAVRTKTPLSLLILDLDYFKNYNDTYGHIQGDKALRLVAKIFAQELRRPGDLVARWGGEEFVVLLADTDINGAIDVANRIRLNVEKMEIPLFDNFISKITVSIGVNTIIPTTSDSLEDFIRNADTALYTAKKEGRNKVFQHKE